MRASGGSSLKETSWAISARVLTLSVRVPSLLMKIGMILMTTLRVQWVSRACLRGSYMVYMWSITTCVFPSVEYLYSIICRCFLPPNVGSLTS